MIGGRGSAAALVAALLVSLVPLPAEAVISGPAVRPMPPAPQLAATVDHPAADGVDWFDSGPRTVARVALTFDADMTTGMLDQLRSGAVPGWYNRQVREILDAERVPATIFLTGLWAAAYPAEARSLAEDPLFEIGNHSVDHRAFRTPCYGLPAVSDGRWEILQAQEQIEAVTGVVPALFRFPGDCYDTADVALAHRLGLAVVSGDVRAGDGFNWSAQSIASTVLASVRPGSIVVMHIHGGPNAPMTAPALRTIIGAIRERGLGFATVSQLLGRVWRRRAVRDGERLLAGGSALLQACRRHRLQAPAALLRRRPAIPFFLL